MSGNISIKVVEGKGSVAIAGDGHPIKVVQRNLSEDVKNGKNCLMKISGEWYDIADFMDQHPGGDILKEFVGKDITVMYRLWHPTFVFNNPGKFVKHVPAEKVKFLDEKVSESAERSTSASASTAPNSVTSDASDEEKVHIEEVFHNGKVCVEKEYFLKQSPLPMCDADQRYLEIYKSAEKRGFFKGTVSYVRERLALMAIYFAAASICFHYCSSVYLHAIGAFCMFQVWYQCAGLMHDSCHNQYFNGIIKKNERLMFWTANVGFGVSSSFWKWEHVEHHTFSNSYDHELGNADPQGNEVVWTQDAQLVDYRDQNLLNWIILRVQTYLFPIAIIFFSRFGFVFNSFVTETRAYEFGGLALHLSWVFWMLSTVYREFGFWYALFCYGMAAMCFCVLSFQLESNHMDRPWIEKLEEFDANGRPMSHIHRHMRACTNIEIPRCLDAYWAGLQFHMEHHCFPRMAREHYRIFAPEWREFCEDFGYDYNSQTFSETMRNVMGKLHEVKNIRDIFDLGKEHDQ